ncbi:hypothetical protein ACIRPK_21465 [Kitasatospora sp. NPDC101801]|uniref:hypothetical protein n=1 Tax=Kitasatospora sp. NPDC101801 TaxID=3364103 RepID=UPI0037F82A4D
MAALLRTARGFRAGDGESARWSALQVKQGRARVRELRPVTGGAGSGRSAAADPAEAELTVNVRSYTPAVRAAALAGIERIVRADAAASGATREPEFAPLDSFPVLVNDRAAVDRARAALVARLGERSVVDPGPVTGSEDVGAFGAAAGVPTCYWLLGGTDPAEYARAEAAGRVARDIPSNHSPHYAPVIEPTLDTGVTALVTVAAGLAKHLTAAQ